MEPKNILLLSTSLLVLVGLSTQIYLNGSVPTFDPKVAIDADYYSKASYCNINQIKSWSCGASCRYHSKVKEVYAYNSPVTQVQVYCAYNPDSNTIVVAFRGSSNTVNWIADFSINPVEYPACEGCQVHFGFKTALESVSSGVNSCVIGMHIKYPTASALVTGHSLGGALATLSVLEIATIIDPKRISFINFGSPRVGNQQFVNYFMSIIPNGLRVVNYRDIVPHMPLQDMNFRHVNYEVWMLSNGAVNNFKVCPLEEDPSCSDSLLTYNTEDHSNYFGFSTGC